MQIIKKKEKIGNTLFFIGILLEIIIMMTDHSQITLPLRGRVSHLAFLLFGCKILTTKYTKKEWIIIVLFGLLGAASYLTCGDEYFIRAIVMVVAAKEIDIYNIAKTILFATLAGTTVIVVLSLTGTLGTVVDIRNYGRGMEEARWCLGFSHANNVHSILWYIMLLYFYLENDKCSWKHYLGFSIANVLLFLLTASRTGALVVQILVIGCAAVRYLPALCRNIVPYLLAASGLIGCIFVTLLGGLRGRFSPLSMKLDDLLTGRLEMVWEYAPVSKWTLFPGSTSLNFVDNGFACIFYSYGIVIGITYIVLLLYMIYHMYKTGNGVAVVFLVTVIFSTLMESTFILNSSLLCNPMLFLLFNEWYKPNAVKKKEGSA